MKGRRMQEKMAGRLVLADGTTLDGAGAGATGTVVGELVFQTGMTGYQEALTDPSYCGQLLIFTYPLVGNYGVGAAMDQSAHIQARGMIAGELMDSAGHRDTGGSLDDLLRAAEVPALIGADTRFLTRRVRTEGVIAAALAVAPPDRLPTVADLQAQAVAFDYDATDFVAGCSTVAPVWHPPARPDAPRIVLVDYGTKTSTLEHLRAGGAGVWVVPARSTAAEILSLQPDGVLLSNGPGDPAALGYAIANVRDLLDTGRVPIFGICLGHQLLTLAAGGRTTKMRFGHRGVNQPVLELDTGRVAVTT